MGQLLLLTIGALAVGAIGFGIAVLITGSDPGLVPAESQSQPVPLPVDRPLAEGDLARIRFDTALRGYRMAQVDAALRRAAYDTGYKLELISVLEAEVEALRDGRVGDADKFRAAREAASNAISGGSGNPTASAESAAADEPAAAEPADAEPATDEPATDEPATGEPAGVDSAAETDSADSDISPHRPQEIRR